MKFSLFAGLGSFVMAALLCNSAFAQDDYTSPYILKGPHFSLDEPWKVSQFNEALVGKTCAFEELTDASQLDTTQGKTIKTEVGKIYYLEVDKDNEYEQRAFIGLRRVVNDKQIVSFYTVQPKDNVGVMLHSSGTSAITESSHSLNGIYNATYGDKNFRIIEFNQIDWDEYSCRDYFFMDYETGKLDVKGQKKCMASRVKMSVQKLAFAIDENGNVMASGVVSDAKKRCSDVDKCNKELSKKSKSIKDVKEFNLGSDMICTPNKPANKKEAPTVSCRRK